MQVSVLRAVAGHESLAMEDETAGVALLERDARLHRRRP
jgi:hypothetical protein